MRFIKQISFLILALALAVPAYGQKMLDSNNRTASSTGDLEAIIDLSGSNSTVMTKVGGNDLVGFNLNKSKESTTINFSLPGKGGTATVQLIRNGEVLHSYADEAGPNGGTFTVPTKNVLYSTTYAEDKEMAWPLIAAIALCCVQAEVSYSQSDGWSGSVGFDCDCFSSNGESGTVPVSVNGREFQVDEIRVIPNATFAKTSAKTSRTSISIK